MVGVFVERGVVIMGGPGLTAAGLRRYPIEYRLEFLQLWDAAGLERGARSRLLRERGLTSATVSRWTRDRAEGRFTESMVAQAQRSKVAMDNADRAELARLRTENDALRAKLAQSEAVQVILGKAYELLEQVTKSSIPDPTAQIPPALMNADDYAAWLRQRKLS